MPVPRLRPLTDRLPRRLAWSLAALAAFTTFAVVQAARIALVRADRGEPAQWGPTLERALVDWWSALVILPVLLWLVRRWPVEPERWAVPALVQIAGAGLCAAAQDALLVPALHALFGLPAHQPLRPGRVVGTAIPNVLALGIIHAAHYARRLRQREVEAARLAGELAEAQLAALRAQLHPHFLFNTLNAVAALIPRDPRAADRMVTRLAALLRATLEHAPSHEHPLRDELALLDQYLDVMHARFGPRLAVERRVDAALGDALVPWLVLQPLAENALEHGVARAEGPGRVVVAAERRDGALRLTVDDSGGDAAGPPHDGHGIGLANVRRRLDTLYGAAARVALGPSPEGGVRVEIELPYRTAEGHA